MSETEETPEEVIDGLTADQFKALIANLNPKRVASRSQGGSKLSYLEAWDVRASLIRIFGFGGWSADLVDKDVVSIERDVPKSGGGTTAFRVTATVTMRLHIPQLGCTYTEVAASSQAGSVPGDVLDFALKTAASDALKRCAMNLGTQFGLSLYNKGAVEDIVRVVFEPRQAALLKAIIEARETPKDPTPDDTLHGIGELETMPGEAPLPAVRDWAADAAKLKTSDEVAALWREAKVALPKNDPILAILASVGRTLKDAEIKALKAMEPAVAEKEAATAAVARGFEG